MDLITKLEFIGTDNTGRIITVRDSTGLYDPIDNPNGYGGPNLNVTDINSILFTISEWESKKLNKLRFILAPDIDHPEYLTIPTISDIANGIVNVEFTSIVLGITDPQSGLKAFKDGVYDINMYTLFSLFTGVDVVAGSKEITSSSGGLDIVYNNFDYVVINNSAYTINKLVPSDNNSLLLDREAEEDSSELYGANRANVKGMNQEASNCCGVQSAAKIATEKCGCNGKSNDTLFTVWMFKIAAQMDFNCKNYGHAHDLLTSAEKLCKCLNCKC